MKVALVQMDSTEIREKNEEKALRLMEQAMEQNPDIICLSESFVYWGKDATQRRCKLEDIEKYQSFARKNEINLVYEYIKKYDFWQKVDGSIFSFEEKMCKPERKIYETLIQKYNLIPEETIFVDDMKENIDVAENLKMNGIVFQNLKQVEMEIETYLSLDR